MSSKSLSDIIEQTYEVSDEMGDVAEEAMSGDGQPAGDDAAKAQQDAEFGVQDDGFELMPMVALRDLVVFPGEVVRFDVGRDKSRAAVEKAYEEKLPIMLVAQRDRRVDEPILKDMYMVGVVANVINLVKLPNQILSVAVQGVSRALLIDMARYRPYCVARVERFEDRISVDDVHMEALIEVARAQVSTMESMVKNSIPASYVRDVMEEESPSRLADVLGMHLVNKLADRVKLLETADVAERLESVCRMLSRAISIMEIEQSVQKRVSEQIDKNQKEYYLREQIRAIQRELGDREAGDVSEYRERLKRTPLNDEARDKVEREIARLEGMAPGTPEIAVSSTYIEWVLDLPWGKRQTAPIDTQRARRTLDKDHYGLERVKERLIEYLAVRALKNDMKGPCICLVGPPGVGKTSIAQSIARALKRPLAHVSLGGVRDEAEIRGHRRTYVGAIPGRIMSAIRQAGSMTPVFLLDEIDKMGADYKGDPASAMLEVLDGEQNFAFRDHYLEIPFDLSGVMFIMTANSLDTIPRPLLDRMEVIEIEGYTAGEKLEIAKHHLLARQLREHGLDKRRLRMRDDAIAALIEGYTREAGVRQLERELGAVCRKAACRFIENEELKSISVKAEDLRALLGAPKFHRQEQDMEPEVGSVNGLAWTAAGGETLAVEAAVMPGSGRFELTGQLGDVMQESARAALSVIRTRSDSLGLDSDFYKKSDLHIHVPEGAVPKDGPSAGVTMTCALVSALTGLPARQDVAMTGEITLRGKVLPIGGVKEKVLAAHRMGIRTVLLPRDNESDLDEIPQEVRSVLDLRLIGNVDQALDAVLIRGAGKSGGAQ